jgi:hypothetical protein
MTRDPFGRGDLTLALHCAACARPIRVGDLYHRYTDHTVIHHHCYLQHGLGTNGGQP